MVHRDITVREGTSEKYWYTLAGYIAICILAVFYNVYIFAQAGGNVQTAGLMSGFSIIAVSGLGLITYPALFKDSAYLRGTNRSWKPKWWYFFGIGLGIPALASAVVPFVGVGFGGGVVGAMLHVLTAPVMAGYYLYKRHKHIGVP